MTYRKFGGHVSIYLYGFLVLSFSEVDIDRDDVIGNAAAVL